MNKIFFKKELHVYIDSMINSKPVMILPEKEIMYDDPHDPKNWDEIKLLSFDDIYNNKRWKSHWLPPLLYIVPLLL